MNSFFRNISNWFVSGFMEMGRVMEFGVRMV